MSQEGQEKKKKQNNPGKKDKEKEQIAPSRLWVWISTHRRESLDFFWDTFSSGSENSIGLLHNSGLREHKGGCRGVWPGERGWGRRLVPFLFSSCREQVLGVNPPGSWSFKQGATVLPSPQPQYSHTALHWTWTTPSDKTVWEAQLARDE